MCAWVESCASLQAWILARRLLYPSSVDGIQGSVLRLLTVDRTVSPKRFRRDSPSAARMKGGRARYPVLRPSTILFPPSGRDRATLPPPLHAPSFANPAEPPGPLASPGEWPKSFHPLATETSHPRSLYLTPIIKQAYENN